MLLTYPITYRNSSTDVTVNQEVLLVNVSHNHYTFYHYTFYQYIFIIFRILQLYYTNIGPFTS
jgi:hypothetical protein